MINYKQVADKLQSLIPNDCDGIHWVVEMVSIKSIDKDIVSIFLRDMSVANSYRLYHSELNYWVESDEQLFGCCIWELREIYSNIKNVMSGVLNGGIVLKNEMEE